MEYLLAVRWLACYWLVALAALPAASLAFRRFPDRGASLALPLGLAAMGLAGFLVGHLSFGTPALWAGVAAVVGPSMLALRRGVAVDLRRYAEAMVVFSAAFALLVAIRAGNPSVVAAGGEKFLDYWLLKSTLRAEALPPEDVWFAGESVRYYYGTPTLTALLARLSATPARFAYNLALAGFYGALLTAAYGLAGAVADARGGPRRTAGLLGAFLVGLAGPLATPGRMLLGRLPASTVAEYGHVLLDGLRIPYEEAVDVAASPGTFSFWEARYVVPDVPTLFPLWAFRNGDLNAYMVATPFLLLAAAVAFAYYRTPEAALTRRRLLVLGVAPALAGHLTTVSTWSLPTAVGLTWLALALADARPATLLPAPVTRLLGVVAVGRDGALDDGGGGAADGGRHGPAHAAQSDGTAAGRLAREARRTTVATGLALVVGALAVAWASPYLLFHTPVNRGIGLLPPRSGFGALVLVWGAFLGAFALYLAPRWWSTVTDRPRWQAAAGGVALACLLGWLALQADLAAVALFGPFLVVGWLLVRADADVGYETVLLVAACGVLLVVEFAYARVWPFDPNAPRWNTVYKVSMQAWVLLGTAAAAAVARLLGGLPGPADLLRRGRGRIDLRGGYRAFAVVAAVALVVASAAFPAVALPTALAPAADADVQLTLDGTSYVEDLHADEHAAIEYLDGLSGQPNMVSAPGETVYTWVNAPATLTGIPTVAGWRHAAGYHGLNAYETRVYDVQAIYTAPWPTTRALLLKHDVELIYHGPNEVERFGARNFSQYRGVSTAFEGGNVTIYRVNRTVVGNATATG